MKVKRQKMYKRIMSVYSRSFGFREPYQMLLDGTFIQVALSMRMDPRDALPKILGGTVRPMTTFCVHEELKLLGEDFRGALINARRFEKRRCPHDSPIPAADCISSIIGETNQHKYGVASQDIQLRKTLRKVPGTPLVYVSSGVTILEPPSLETKEKAAEIERSKAVGKIPKPVTPPSTEVVPSVTRKKKPLAPNPLSVKKKKKATPTADQIAGAFKKVAKEGDGEKSVEKVVGMMGGVVAAVKKSTGKVEKKVEKDNDAEDKVEGDLHERTNEEDDCKSASGGDSKRKRNRRKPKKRIGESG
ncbi:Fcf1-domain-containing protein [Chytridium lagenaria]|nr:Fcf1-domain-containing protein [Chytridium lagenaria]